MLRDIVSSFKNIVSLTMAFPLRGSVRKISRAKFGGSSHEIKFMQILTVTNSPSLNWANFNIMSANKNGSKLTLKVNINAFRVPLPSYPVNRTGRFKSPSIIFSLQEILSSVLFEVFKNSDIGMKSFLRKHFKG